MNKADLQQKLGEQEILGKRQRSSLQDNGDEHDTNSVSSEPSEEKRMRLASMAEELPTNITEQRVADVVGETKGHISVKEFSDVLLIVTGGTLCMVNSDDGYVVERGLGERLKKIHTFYDKDFCIANNIDEEWLVTPLTPHGKRIRFKVLEFPELIDSSNILLKDQVRMAKTIEEHYKNYDGFVICHGTDTMAYSSSVLSFMLENLNKSVILTGSQIPIAELRSDSVDNLLGAMLVAGPYLIPEVCIFFGNRLYRGNRSTKASSSTMQAFDSPNMEPLAKFGVHFDVAWDKVLKYQSGQFHTFTKLNTDVSYIALSPLMNLRAIELVLSNSKAVILAGYGMGNLPSANQDLMRLLRHAVAIGVIVVIKTQCYHGTVDDLYEAGRQLTKVGCILANDMTIECLFAKLAYLLGKGYTNDKVKKMMHKSLRGELTDATKSQSKFSLTNNNMVQAVAEYLKVESQEEVAEIHETLTPVLVNSVIASGNLEMLKKLVHSSDVDLNHVDYMGRAPLHVASGTKGSIEICEYLTSQPINLDCLDHAGSSPLCVAIIAKQTEIVKHLQSKGATCIAEESRIAEMLCRVGYEGNLEQLMLLHRCEVNLEVSDYDLRNIGHLAASEGHLDLLEFLINHTNFDFDLADRWGRSPLEEMAHKVSREDKMKLKKLIKERENNK